MGGRRVEELEAEPGRLQAAVDRVVGGAGHVLGPGQFVAGGADGFHGVVHRPRLVREGRRAHRANVVARLLRTLRTVATEIERKFAVARMPGSEQLGPGVSIRQGYLAAEGEVEVRVRVADDAGTITVKAGTGRARTEVEVPVSGDEAEELFDHIAGRMVEKARHRVALDDGLVAEVDVYSGLLVGLQVVEVEFSDDAMADGFDPPSWFGEELTGRPEWSNSALARRGRPPA